MLGILTYKGTGDDPSHCVLTLHDRAGNPAVFIQLLERNLLLVGCNLKDAVRRGVDNQIAGLQMLFPVVVDDLCAGVRTVAQNSSAGALCQLLDDSLRKAVGIGRIGFSETSPISSQCPVVVSLPAERSAILPKLRQGFGRAVRPVRPGC